MRGDRRGRNGRRNSGRFRVVKVIKMKEHQESKDVGEAEIWEEA